MPLVYQQNINDVTKLAVWYIAEKEEFFLIKVPLQKEIRHPLKRLQHLAGRYLLTQLFKDFPLELIEIADTKKPFLSNEAYHFSISHCGDYAAVIVSAENRVGTDIEVFSEKASKIRNRFLSVAEINMIEETITNVCPTVKLDKAVFSLHLITSCWSVKETMFKWDGSGQVDFKQQLRIRQVEFDRNEFIATCEFLKDGSKQLSVHGMMFNNHVLTWTVS